WSEVLETFQERYPHIKIEFSSMSSSEYWEKLPIMLASHEVDILDVTNYRIGQLVTQGMLLDLTPYAERDLNLADYFAVSLDRGRWPYPDGPLWTLWTFMSPTLFYYNTDHFDQVGLPYPTDNWTYEDELDKAIRR